MSVTMIEFLQSKAREEGMDLPDDVALSITMSVSAYPDQTIDLEVIHRRLAGALIRVIAYASLTGQPLTAALADEVLHQTEHSHHGGKGVH